MQQMHSTESPQSRWRNIFLKEKAIQPNAQEETSRPIPDDHPASLWQSVPGQYNMRRPVRLTAKFVPPVLNCGSCALQVHEIQLPEMATAVKLGGCYEPEPIIVAALLSMPARRSGANCGTH